jgi:hypothetical protein
MAKRSSKKVSLTKVTTEDRNAIVRFVAVGVDTATVLKAYPEYTRQQVAALRAHNTMGNYSGIFN